MNDAVIMRCDQALHDLQGVSDGQRNRHRSLGQPFAQGLAYQQLTNDVRSAFVETNVIDGNDVGMIQGSGGAGLEFEAAKMIGVGAGSWTDYLQSDVTPQPLIASPENFAHGSSADFFDDPVMTYDLASHTQHAPLAC